MSVWAFKMQFATRSGSPQDEIQHLTSIVHVYYISHDYSDAIYLHRMRMRSFSTYSTWVDYAYTLSTLYPAVMAVSRWLVASLFWICICAFSAEGK